LGFDREFVEMLTITSPLHDIGKIGIPDYILRKPGKLTPEEWETMRQHCIIGSNFLLQDYALPVHRTPPLALLDDKDRQPQNQMLRMAATIALNHHEKWNGSGYPRGLSGEDIPMEARIVAIADVYDALRSVRPYKPAYEESATLEYMETAIGQHFDPYAFSGLRRSLDAMRDIRAEYPDIEASLIRKAA